MSIACRFYKGKRTSLLSTQHYLAFVPYTIALQARDEDNQPRLSGGDTFNVLLVTRVQHKTAAAQSVDLMQAAVPLDAVPHNAARTPEVATAASSVEPADSSKAQLVCVPAGGTVGGRSRLISHPILMPGSFSSSDGSSSAKGSTVLLQQVEAELKSQASEARSLPDYPEHWHNEEHEGEVVAVTVGDIQDNGDGTYGCSYSYTTAGLYELHIINGKCSTGSWARYGLCLLLHSFQPSTEELRSLAALFAAKQGL